MERVLHRVTLIGEVPVGADGRESELVEGVPFQSKALFATAANLPGARPALTSSMSIADTIACVCPISGRSNLRPLMGPGPSRWSCPLWWISRRRAGTAGDEGAYPDWRYASSARSSSWGCGSSCSTLGVFTQDTIPSPVSVVRAGHRLWASGQLQSNFAVSLGRVGVGLAIGTTVGLVLAVISGLFRLGEDLVDPLVQILRSVPILGLVPLVIIWFGVGETPKIFLIALGCVFAVYVNTHAAIRDVDANLAEMGTVFGLSRLGLAGRVLLRAGCPASWSASAWPWSAPG